ncbi:MAG: UvrD-helicase domain-containing protein, partial [Candidatus Kapabacteria bacterium]|nr:UvrD-helicase domain-containing protein [Candidatus Kapabacteria bacterium]
MQWTPEQQWAVSVDRHAIVTASAGSGKTAVLVRRYVELVLSGVDPRAIVAITFTRKAAAEMYARIAAEIDRQIAEATAPQEIA